MGTGFGSIGLLYAGMHPSWPEVTVCVFGGRGLHLVPFLRDADSISRTLMLGSADTLSRTIKLRGADSMSCTLLRSLMLRSLGLSTTSELL